MNKDLIIQKQDEIIAIQGITIAYFHRYSGESERIAKFLSDIEGKQEELEVLKSEPDKNPIKQATMKTDELIVKLKEIISHMEEFEECRKYNTIDQLNFEAMKEYHLFKQKQSQPTNEDIEKWANEVQPERGGHLSDYIFAAKAMRDGKITNSKK